MPIIPTTYLTHKPKHSPHRGHASNNPCLSEGQHDRRCSQTIRVPPKDSAPGGVRAAPGGAQPLSPWSWEGAWRKPRPTHQVDGQAACAEGGAWQTTKKRQQRACRPARFSQLLAWVFAHSEQGIVVTKVQVVFKASALLHSFGAKTFEACFQAVNCFLG